MKKRNAAQAFSEAAAEYDLWVKQAIPRYDEIFSVAVEVVPFDSAKRIIVADLGAGSGLFSRHVLAAYPKAVFTLVDASSEMLDKARIRFDRQSESFTFIEQRLEAFSVPERFDVVISSLAIHHLEDAEKRSLFKRIFTALRPGGAFINVDQVKGRPPFDRLYWETWLAKVRATGASESKIKSSVKRRKAFDCDAGLTDQLTWLTEAGFVADCIYKHYFVAVFLALKELKRASH
jgi:tRNA (cmo5U34)-methyltransferase